MLVLIIFPVILQTVINLIMLSVGGRVGRRHNNWQSCSDHLVFRQKNMFFKPSLAGVLDLLCIYGLFVQAVLYGWLGGLVIRALDSWPKWHEFNSQLPRKHITTLGKLFTCICCCHQGQWWSVARKMTVDLAFHWPLTITVGLVV